MNSTRYKFQPGEPGTLVEIYLPSKYEPVLLDILERALDFEHVCASFPDALTQHDAEAAALNQVLPEPIQIRYDDLVKTMRKFKNVFFGFSTFVVEGAFADLENASKLYKERSTIVRIILRPKFEDLYGERPGTAEEARKLAKWFFRSGLRPEDVKLDWEWMPETKIESKDLELILKLGEWQDLGALFIYGFVLRRIIQIPEIREEEIWVTSYHNPVVNVIQRVR